MNGVRAPKGKPVSIKNHDRISFVVSGGMHPSHHLPLHLPYFSLSFSHLLCRIDIPV